MKDQRSSFDKMALTICITGSVWLSGADGVQASQPIVVQNATNHVQSQAPKLPTNENATAHQKSIEALVNQIVKEPGIPGMIVQSTRNGQKWSYAAGEANIEDKSKMRPDFHFRIGSVSKMFVATVVLQLAEEKKLSLDDSVEKWLPGVLNSSGFDGNKIKIRHLLNHTSGIPDSVDQSFLDMLIHNPKMKFTLEEELKVALSKKPLFAPGTDVEYANTNTILAGMIILKATGKSYEEQIKERIIVPLKLTGTSLPGSSTLIPVPHARGYFNDLGEGLKDYTNMNLAWAGGPAGDIISTTDDLNTFIGALLGGKLLKPEMLDQMLTGTPYEDGGYGLNNVGLGIFEYKLANGTSVWGHGGGVPGSNTLVVGTVGGEHVISMNVNVLDRKVLDRFYKLIEKEFQQ
ncbi:serine hydrolase domain-containing protein [Brevibacillus fortis]|uniref:serine hydrolase domain-containing protein n=1 Tax=Brevibacillus fortis TaxID=2126352 RepID=UPI0038FBF991